MVDQTLLPAITEAIRQNEGATGDPYALSYAKLGTSGASFGALQGDTHARPASLQVLRNVLAAANAPQAAIDRIAAALAVALPAGDPLSPADRAMANAALASPAGRKLVDDMDHDILSGVLADLDRCAAAVAARAMTLAPIVNLYIAPWINMTGAPTTLLTWLEGAETHGVPAPAPPQVRQADIAAFLRASKYFQAHPRNFVHFEQSVQAGAKLLPAHANS